MIKPRPIKKLKPSPPPPEEEEEDDGPIMYQGKELVAEQTEAVRRYKKEGLLVVSGRPGSGKTTLIGALLAAVRERTLLCAPTGSAANRLEAVTDYNAFTIDHVLGTTALIQQYKRANIIVDEASMVSMEMMTRLVSELNPRRLVIVGDFRQLPCVNGISSLATFLNTPGMPMVTLKANHRQTTESALTWNIDHLGEGREPRVDDKFKLFPCATSALAAKRAIEMYKELVAEGVGVQFIAYPNKTCDELNIGTIRDAKAQEVAPGIYVGDRIVCTHNFYHKKEKVLMVANGVVGTVKGKNKIEYDNKFKDNRGKNGFNTKFVVARAMTGHKSQGNEFSEVGMLILNAWPKPSTEWFYTCLSRFKVKLYVFGTGKEIRDAFEGRFSSVIDEQYVKDFVALDTFSLVRK